ncbi:MAG: dihydroneopterin aldolase [Ignavibacteria bacterium]|jgi:dihydroneopterin aldolase|nr:dihydroneopterin aldolase [Ignavibacteria bacterium]
MNKPNLTRLSIHNAEFYGYHGAKQEEHLLGGRYQVDLDIYYDATLAIEKDQVQYAVNYENAFYCIEEVICDDSYNLIETIAYDILKFLLDRTPQIEKATIRVRKLNAPIRRVLDYVEAEHSLSRAELKPSDE